MNNNVVIKPWGREYCCFRNQHVAIWVLEIRKGLATSLHCHPNKNTALIVLRGEVELSFIRGPAKRLVGLDKINIFRGRFHRTRALETGVVLLEVEAPDDKRDLVRLEDGYGRAGLPIEEPTVHKDDSCLKLVDNRLPHFFASRHLFFVHPTTVEDDLCWQDAHSIFVTLSGGLEHGLLPPGDAVDGATMERLARVFPPLPGSYFLLIQQWMVP